MSFVIQSENLREAAAGMRLVIQRIDKDLPTDSVTTMDSVIADSMTGTRSQTRLPTIFSIVALLLAAIGIYGVLASSVAERTHEIGIRMAVGAGRKDIVWMVIRRTLVLAANGVFIGLFGVLALTRLLTKLLFGVTPTDPATLRCDSYSGDSGASFGFDSRPPRGESLSACGLATRLSGTTAATPGLCDV